MSPAAGEFSHISSRPLRQVGTKVNDATMSSRSGGSSPKSAPASTRDDDAAEEEAAAAAIRAARHAEARRRALERAGARARAARGLRAKTGLGWADDPAPSPPPARVVDDEDRGTRWWEEKDEDARDEVERSADEDDAATRPEASRSSGGVVSAMRTVTAAAAATAPARARRPAVLPPPSLPTAEPRTNPTQIGVSTHAKHKAKATAKASAANTHGGVPKTLGMAMCSCCGKRAFSARRAPNSTVLRSMGMPPPARVNVPGYDNAKKGAKRETGKGGETTRLVPCARCAAVWCVPIAKRRQNVAKT